MRDSFTSRYCGPRKLLTGWAMVLIALFSLFQVDILAQVMVEPDAPTSGINSDELSQADVVAVVEVRPVGSNSFQSLGQEIASLFGQPTTLKKFRLFASVKHVFKGVCPADIYINVAVPVKPSRLTEGCELSIGRPLLAILRNVNGGNGSYEPVMPGSWLSLTRGYQLANGQPNLMGFINDALRDNLKESTNEPPTSADLKSLDGWNLTNDEAKALYIEQSRYALIQSLDSASTLHVSSQEVLHSISSLWSSSDEEIQSKALSASLSIGDESVLKYCADEWKLHPSDPRLKAIYSAPLSRAIFQMMRAKEFSNIVPFLTSEVPSVRIDAFSAIATAKDPIYLPQLVSGLDDPESSARYHAMLGLYSLDPDFFREEGVPIAFIKQFSTKPDFYINAWKKWINNGGLQKLQVDLNIK